MVTLSGSNYGTSILTLKKKKQQKYSEDRTRYILENDDTHTKDINMTPKGFLQGPLKLRTNLDLARIADSLPSEPNLGSST